jgi:predicted negative regulator of RcsB-dependent stress response
MTEATQPQSQTLEQTLNKTDLGHVIYENRKLFFGILGVILVAICGYVFYKQAKQSSALNNSVKVFEFQSKIWAEAKAGKITPADLAKSFQNLDKDVQASPIMLPVVLEMGKFLFDKEAYTEAESILSITSANTKNSIASFFVSTQRAVVLEKLGKTDEAIAIYENLAKEKDGLMGARVSLELGRLYLAKGEKAKAQTQFDYILSTFPNDDQAKLAKLYLAKLAE